LSGTKGRTAAAVTAVTALLSAAVVVAALALRNGDDGEGVAPGAKGTPATSPFTGLPARADSPVIAIKVDNVRPARPQTGLSKADIVYIEPVEAGLSRILAVFSSRLPDRAGPVRSARESDLELLRQFGRPALAFSGAQSKLLPVIARAPVYDVSAAKAANAYVRDSSRQAPHNLYASPEKLLARAPEASKAHDIGFRFGGPPPGGAVTAEQTVRYDAAAVRFRWSAGQNRWLVSLDGAPATATENGRLGAPTVVIQYINVRASQFKDRGATSPRTARPRERARHSCCGAARLTRAAGPGPLRMRARPSQRRPGHR
jgi:hypothetical protein